MSVNLLGPGWKKLLDKFSDQVKTNCYDKIPYQTWKTIYTDKYPTEVRLGTCPTILIVFVEGPRSEQVHCVTDRGFYDFISHELFPKSKGYEDFLINTLKSTTSNVCTISDSSSTADVILNNTNYSTATIPINYYDSINSNSMAIKSSNYLPYTIYYDESIKGEIEIIKKENENTMKFNIDFGPVSSNVRMSMYGMAIKNKDGNYVSYNKDTDELVDVDIFNFEGSKFMYKMPVAISEVKVGDVVIHNGAPCFVKGMPNEQINTFHVIDVYAGEAKEILLPVNMFGFNYCTKVVNFMEGMFNASAATADNPFGNMLPMLLLGDGAKSEDMLPIMMMMSQNINMFNSPVMMYLMFKDNKNIDPMMLMLMSQVQAPHTCNCEKKK